MVADGFYGYDLSRTPVTVASGGTYMFNQISIIVPTNVTLRENSYYVGIDGTQGTSSTVFSWNSPSASIDIIGGNSNSTPIATNSGEEQPLATPHFLQNPANSPTVPEFPQALMLLVFSAMFLVVTAGLIAHRRF